MLQLEFNVILIITHKFVDGITLQLMSIHKWYHFVPFKIDNDKLHCETHYKNPLQK
jgi:hypothetical protein